MMSASDIETNWGELVKSQKSHTATNEPDNSRIDKYYFLFNSEQNEVEYVNSAFEIVTGYNVDEFTIQKLLDIIHPDDVSYFIECEERGLNFSNTLLFNEHFRYYFSYCYRVRTATGIYIKIRQTCQAIEVNTKGHLTKTFVTHLKEQDTTRNENDYRIFDKDKSIFLDAKSFYNLTTKERQVFEYIQMGHNSRKIAELMHISVHTINTHRKNILNKTNAANFMELSKKLTILS